MSRQLTFAALAWLGLAPGLHAQVVGQPAPAFEAVDSNGRTHSLAAYQGKWVVLEWTNDGCPFVQKHYGSGNMQRLQQAYTQKGVVWLSVISSAPGKQGYADGARANALTKDRAAHPSAVLLDPSGQLGRAYAAKTTPHMFVIDPQGKLIYAGGIDDAPSADPADIPRARNFVSAALDAALRGQPVATATSTPYGCSVKYN